MIVQWLINNDEIQERDKILYKYALNEKSNPPAMLGRME